LRQIVNLIIKKFLAGDEGTCPDKCGMEKIN
jgi:hypothetical protein